MNREFSLLPIVPLKQQYTVVIIAFYYHNYNNIYINTTIYIMLYILYNLYKFPLEAVIHVYVRIILKFTYLIYWYVVHNNQKKNC